MTKKGRKLLAVSLSLVMICSAIPLPVITTQEIQAAGHGISNPRTDKNGVSTWDCIYFGNYYQDNSESKEPVKWRVLSVNGEDAFLLADQNLDCQPYHTEQADVTWETCTLRSWLNNDFYHTAFSALEQSAIKITTVVNEDNPYGGEGGNTTEDKIYLLSLREAGNPLYGFPSNDDYDSSKTREAKNTEYTKGREAYTNDYAEGYAGNGYWWLRSPGEFNQGAALVDCYGSIFPYGDSVVNGKDAVRPALHLDLSSDTWSKAGTVSAPGGTKAKQDPVNVSTGKTDVTVPPKNNVKKVTAPGKVQKLTAKNKKEKSVVLSWKKVSGAKGYEIQYATNKKYKKKTSKFTKKTKFTVKKLKKKKTYYFRVRAYKLNGKKKVSGKWSKIKKVKVKK